MEMTLGEKNIFTILDTWLMAIVASGLRPLHRAKLALPELDSNEPSSSLCS